MAVYKVTGKGENKKVSKVSPSEVKRTIMRANNWTEDEYRKKYDLFKNKLRAYESYMKAKGKTIKQQSVVDVLYAQAKSKLKHGEDYRPSATMKRIQSFSAVSITKGRALAKTDKYISRRDKIFEEQTKTNFEMFLKKNPKAQEIYDAIDDPLKREQALSDYAEAVHKKIAEEIKAQEKEAIPYGETYGSDEALDFDIDKYL